MTLILNNDDVKSVLTMKITIEALEEAYKDLVNGNAVCRPRVDIQIPTKDPQKVYQWGTMEGGSSSGYFAIRMKSDVIYEQVTWVPGSSHFPMIMGTAESVQPATISAPL